MNAAMPLLSVNKPQDFERQGNFMSLLNWLSKLNHLRLDLRHSAQLKRRKTRLKSFGDFASGLFVETEQGSFVLNPADSYVARSLAQTGSYGKSEIKQASQYLNPESECVILGGHIGSIAIPLSKYCRKLHVFEPNPDTFKWLSFNVRLNQCQNIVLYNCAVNDTSSELVFIAHEFNSGASRRKPVHDFEPIPFEAGVEIRVPARVLDEVLPEVEPDLIFMDIEGSEYFALKGAQKLLSRTKTLIMEFDSGHFKKVAGKTSKEVWDVFEPHFNRFRNPESGAAVDGKDAVRAEIVRMIDQDESYQSVVFLK